MRVWSAGSVGVPIAAAPDAVARAALSAGWPFCESESVPSAFAVTSSRNGRAPEKCPRTNRPSRNAPLSVPVSPSTRRMVAST